MGFEGRPGSVDPVLPLLDPYAEEAVAPGGGDEDGDLGEGVPVETIYRGT